MTRGQNTNGAWQRFEYDAAGRLVKIKDDSNNVIETYTYGASRNRLVNQNSTQRTYYAWGGSSPIVEYTEAVASSTPTYTKSYVYTGSRLLSTSTKKTSTTTQEVSIHHPDRLGTGAISTPSKSTYEHNSTLPFGTALGAESTAYSNQVFTSYDRSTSTGLDYAVNRTYSQGQSRFTQVDPIGMAAASIGNPQSNNLYGYVQNMPADFVDPSGLNMAFFVCYDINTYYSNANGDQIVRTTTVCWTFGGGGGGSGGGGGETRGGGRAGGGGFEPSSTPTQTQGYKDCAAKWLKGLSSNRIPNAGQASEVLRISARAGISATLFAVTWTGESGFGWHGDNIPNNPNDGSPGNVDIGPMQVNYNTFNSWTPLYTNSNGERIFDARDVFGTSLLGNQPFNGSVVANLSAGANILRSYGGSDRNRAGLYRTGNGSFRNSRAGQAAYNARTSLYDSLRAKYDGFFNCLVKGGFQ